jgi:hypothetical protein
MAEKVLMPKLGLTMTEGTIEEWKKKEGDEVKKGEENSTDTEIGFEAKHFSIYTIAFLKQNGDKAAKFQLDPVDENGKAINI